MKVIKIQKKNIIPKFRMKVLKTAGNQKKGIILKSTKTPRIQTKNNSPEQPCTMKKSIYLQMFSTWLVCNLCLWCSCYANPVNPTAIQGMVEVEGLGTKTCVIKVSDAAFIYMDDFSIAENELTEICQPSSQSTVVIEVINNTRSTLMGTLKSNGNVFLTNPNGMLIGENGHLDTGGFFASTIPACPCPFLDGEKDVYVQGDSKGSIVNEGRIKANDGDVYLIGYQIYNEGVIDALKGTVALAAGEDIVLNQSNGQKIGVFSSPIKYENEETGIDNSGMIIARRAELKADGNSYGIGVRHSGFIYIVGTQEQRGEVFLISEKGNNIISGAITAENADGTGGEIKILGEHIFLFKNSEVDASGNKRGGNIYIGTGTDGTNSETINSKMTFIDEEASIFVDAIEDGDGGTAKIWSDESVYFYGTVSASGGENSGNGGLVEISGKHTLDFQGNVDCSAPNGKEGLLLLSPHSIATNGQ